MENVRSWGEAHAGAWLGVALLAALLTLAQALSPGVSGRSQLASRCAPGDWERTLAEASEAATRGQSTVALDCAYRAFLDAEAAGAGAAMVRVGDLLQNLGVQRYLKVSTQSAYLRAADHARRAQEWPVMAEAAARLLALGELGEASTLLAEVCSRTAGGAPGIPCDPATLAAIPTPSGEE